MKPKLQITTQLIEHMHQSNYFPVIGGKIYILDDCSGSIQLYN